MSCFIKVNSITIKFFCFVLAFCLVSCDGRSKQKPSDVAVNFIEDYYKYKDFNKVKKYFHKDLLTSIDEDMLSFGLVYEERLRRDLSEYEIEFVGEEYRGEKFYVDFSVKVVVDNKKRDWDKEVVLVREGNDWKVWAF